MAGEDSEQKAYAEMDGDELRDALRSNRLKLMYASMTADKFPRTHKKTLERILSDFQKLLTEYESAPNVPNDQSRKLLNIIVSNLADDPLNRIYERKLMVAMFEHTAMHSSNGDGTAIEEPDLIPPPEPIMAVEPEPIVPEPETPEHSIVGYGLEQNLDGSTSRPIQIARFGYSPSKWSRFWDWCDEKLDDFVDSRAWHYSKKGLGVLAILGALSYGIWWGGNQIKASNIYEASIMTMDDSKRLEHLNEVLEKDDDHIHARIDKAIFDNEHNKAARLMREHYKDDSDWYLDDHLKLFLRDVELDDAKVGLVKDICQVVADNHSQGTNVQDACKNAMKFVIKTIEEKRNERRIKREKDKKSETKKKRKKPKSRRRKDVFIPPPSNGAAPSSDSEYEVKFTRMMLGSPSTGPSKAPEDSVLEEVPKNASLSAKILNSNTDIDGYIAMLDMSSNIDIRRVDGSAFNLVYSSGAVSKSAYKNLKLAKIFANAGNYNASSKLFILAWNKKGEHSRQRVNDAIAWRIVFNKASLGGRKDAREYYELIVGGAKPTFPLTDEQKLALSRATHTEGKVSTLEKSLAKQFSRQGNKLFTKKQYSEAAKKHIVAVSLNPRSLFYHHDVLLDFYHLSNWKMLISFFHSQVPKDILNRSKGYPATNLLNLVGIAYSAQGEDCCASLYSQQSLAKEPSDKVLRSNHYSNLKSAIGSDWSKFFGNDKNGKLVKRKDFEYLCQCKGKQVSIKP